MTNFDQEDFLSRNDGLISDKTQKEIQNTRLLFIGMGLGSQIAILAARTGFQKFILCDGDNVELSNLNRQAFNLDDIGKNKAEVIQKKLIKINPNCEIETYPKFIKNMQDAKSLIDKSDIIINMADPEDVLYDINNEAQKQGKPVFFPLNFAYGAYVLIFSPKSDSLEKITEGRTKDDFFAKIVINTIKYCPEIVADKSFNELQELYMDSIKNNKKIPQCGMSANITSSIIVREIVKWIEHAPQEFAPKPVIISPFK